MKSFVLFVIFTAIFLSSAFAGGSTSWKVVRTEIAKKDPELVKVIERCFAVDATGSGRRLGPQFGERSAEIISPYEFRAENRQTKAKLLLTIEESEDYSYTGRFKFTEGRLLEAGRAGEAKSIPSR